MAKMWPSLAAISELKGEEAEVEEEEEEADEVIQRTPSQETRLKWPSLAAISDLVYMEGEERYAHLAEVDEGKEEEEELEQEKQEEDAPKSPLRSRGGQYKLGTMLRNESFRTSAETVVERGKRNSVVEPEEFNTVGSPTKWNVLRNKRNSLTSVGLSSLGPGSPMHRGPLQASLKMHRHSLADTGGSPLGIASMSRNQSLLKFKQHSIRNLASITAFAPDTPSNGWLLNAGMNKREAWKKSKGFNKATLDVSTALAGDEPDSLQQNIYRVRKASMVSGAYLPDDTSGSQGGESRAKRRWKTSVWNNAHPLSALRLAAEKKLLTAISRLYKALPRDREVILDEIKEIKMIKGHPQAAKALIKMLKDKEWRTRLKALELIPRLVIKGDQGAIEAVVDRLLDWNIEVRRAAVRTLRDSPASLTCDILSAKDIRELGGEFSEGHVWCAVRLQSTADDVGYNTQKETYTKRPHWNHHYALKVLDPDEAVVIIDVMATAAPDPMIEQHEPKAVRLASAQVTMPEIYDKLVHAAQWFPLVDENKQPAGALSIKWRFELGAGIGLKSEMTDIIRFVEPALVDEDYWTRKEALQLYTDYYGAGSLEATRVLTRGVQDLVGDVRWTAVEGLRLALSTLDKGCCEMVLEQVVPLVRYENEDEVREAAIEVAYLAGKGVLGWEDPADGKSLKDIMEERLEDDNWMVRRIAVQAFAEMSEECDRDAIITLMPFLGDEVFYVRVNAAKGLAKIAGQLLTPEREPSDEDMELVKAILEGYRDFSERQEQMEAAGLTVGDEVGTRFGLLFKIGVPSQAGWDAKEHATWAHVKAWTDGRWDSVLAAREAKQRRAAGERRLLKNKWVQVGLRLYGLDPKYKGSISEEMGKAVEWAREHAACLIQAMMRGTWGRREARARKEEVMKEVKQVVKEDKKESTLTPIQLLQLRMKMQQKQPAQRQPTVGNVFAQVRAKQHEAGGDATPKEEEDVLRFMIPTPQADVRVRRNRRGSTEAGDISRRASESPSLSLSGTASTPGSPALSRGSSSAGIRGLGKPAGPSRVRVPVSRAGSSLSQPGQDPGSALPQAPAHGAVPGSNPAASPSHRDGAVPLPPSRTLPQVHKTASPSAPRSGAMPRHTHAHDSALGQQAEVAAQGLKAQEDANFVVKPRQGMMAEILPSHRDAPLDPVAAIAKQALHRAGNLKGDHVSRLPRYLGDHGPPKHSAAAPTPRPGRVQPGWIAETHKQMLAGGT